MSATDFKELDESIYGILDSIGKKPGLYLGTPSINRLQSYIVGYNDGLGRVGFAVQGNADFHRFHDWVARRLGFGESTSGWCNMIRDVSTDEADAFRRFFVLLDEFRKESA